MTLQRAIRNGSRSRRGVAAIALGTSTGSVLALILSPVITRLFDPTSFGSFTVLTSVSLVLAPALSLRLELGVPLPEREDSAWALVHVGLTTSILGAVALSTALLVARPFLISGTLSQWLWVTPVMAASMSTFAVLNAMAIRHARYAAIARRNVLMAVSSLGLQIGAGLMGLGVGGLVLGFAAGQVIAAASLLVGSGLRSPEARAGRQTMVVREALSRYRHVPALLSFAGVLSMLGLQAPVFLLALFYDAEVVGWFGLTQRVLAAPLSLIGLSVAQVYLSEIARTRRQREGGEARYFVKASRALLALGVVLASLLLIAAPMLFTTVFGDAWRESGVYARALAIALAAQLTASPLSQTLIVYERSGLQLGWDLFRVAAVGVAVAAPALAGLPADHTVWILGATLTVAYAVSWELSRRTVRANPSVRS